MDVSDILNNFYEIDLAIAKVYRRRTFVVGLSKPLSTQIDRVWFSSKDQNTLAPTTLATLALFIFQPSSFSLFVSRVGLDIVMLQRLDVFGIILILIYYALSNILHKMVN